MTEADELAGYFNEHVFYELQMLRFSKQWLEKEQTQFVWNAMFAAFNVSARNLYDFLGKRENGNMNVADYGGQLLRSGRSRNGVSTNNKGPDLHLSL
jgi:hypothetical protein